LGWTLECVMPLIPRELEIQYSHEQQVTHVGIRVQIKCTPCGSSLTRNPVNPPLSLECFRCLARAKKIPKQSNPPFRLLFTRRCLLLLLLLLTNKRKEIYRERYCINFSPYANQNIILKLSSLSLSLSSANVSCASD